MRTRALVLASCLFVCLSFIAIPAVAQQNEPSSQSGNETAVEGTVTSVSRSTLVVRTDEKQYQLFTYDRAAVRPRSLAPGVRVRVSAGAPDENGTRVATNVTVLSAGAQGGGTTADKGAQAAPVPEKVRSAESEIRRESRRWRLGGRAGIGFDPELFTFGVQSQMGPIFHPRVLFRPNAEFAFGEVTDLIALNLEGIYRFSTPYRGGVWTPYVGAGPAMIFIHQNFQQGRDIDFGNFDYETGFNVLAGMQSRRGMFGELKTSLWSGPAPKLRLIIGYTF
jgi:opacity protein-like surface antigen